MINGQPWSPQSEDAAGGSSSRGPHRLMEIHKCQRKWDLRYGQDYSGGKGRLLSIHGSKNALVGTAVHTRAADYHARQLPKWPAWVTEKTVDERVMDDVKGHPEAAHFLQLSKDMWDEVISSTDPTDMPLPYSVEREVYAPLGQIDPTCPPSLKDEVVTARLDLIATKGTGANRGQLVVWDYKSTGGYKNKDGSVQLPRWASKDPRWSMHYQAALALCITRAMFDVPVAGFFIIRVSRTPPHPIARHMLDIPPGLLSKAGQLATDAVIKEQEAKERRARGLPILPTGSMTGVCGDFGGCEYLSLCRAKDRSTERAYLASDYFWQKPQQGS